MNKVILMGRLTKDAEIRYSQGEESMAVARFTLAVDRRVRRDAEQTADFISCVAFRKTAEFLEKFGHKGTKFVLEGKIQTRHYTNNEGKEVYVTEVVADSMEFAESKSASASAGNTDYSDMAPSPSDAAGDGFMNIPDGIEEELPFN